ncbi:MAG: hypothetical protein BWY82_00516 [Verrucomicrobia bacterium ADurb.Bin474]|nr:MAG: hypothetical protein BWY82_00516 [Verrucomicrobia bacterium ADurb.Bin474]
MLVAIRAARMAILQEAMPTAIITISPIPDPGSSIFVVNNRFSISNIHFSDCKTIKTSPALST